MIETDETSLTIRRTFDAPRKRVYRAFTEPDELFAESIERAGANVMGRRMFSNEDGQWGEDPFEGHWGEIPPFHGPVFVLTHHSRKPLEMDGGTTFHFVTDGIETALERAQAAAGDRDVRISGGADTVRQYVEAGLADEIQLQLVPVLLGDGIRLFESLDTGPIELERTRVVETPGVTHPHFRVVQRETADERESTDGRQQTNEEEQL